MGGIGDVMMVLLVLAGAFVLIKSGKLEEILGGDFKLPALPGLPPLPKLAPAPSTPAPSGEGEEDAPSAPSSGPSAATGTNVYQVVGNIASGGGVTLRGGGTSNRDNLGYPCNKCSRESTWIFKPGTGGDYSLKLGSHGDEGGKETLIELGNINTDSGGGEWQCEGPHMTYNGVSGGSGSGPAIGGKPRVGLKATSWPVGADAVHHEIYYNENGDGSHWVKVAEFTGSASGCNAITCPVPGGSCQDTLRLDNVQGHQFISRSIVEIVPGAGATGGGGAAPTGPRTIGGGTAPAPTTPAPAAGKRTISNSNYARARRAYAYAAAPAKPAPVAAKKPATAPAATTPKPAATAPRPTIEAGAIPITYDATTSRMYINVKLNNSPTPVRMKLDTGAASTLISKAEADTTGVSKLTPVSAGGTTSGGTTVKTNKYNVTMQIGAGAPFQTTVSVRPAAAGAAADGPPASLSRMDLEKSGYSAVLSGGNLRLVKRGTAIVAPALVPSKTHHGLMIDISINGNPLNIIYDTGVTSTILNSADAALAKLDLTKPAGTVEVQSATGGIRKDPFFMVQMKIGTTAAFQTKVNVNATRPVSTLSGADLIKSGHTAVLSPAAPQYVAKGTRVVAAVKTFAPARTRFSNL